jgi:hypothetical protein
MKSTCKVLKSKRKEKYLFPKTQVKCGKWVLTLKLFISPINLMRCLPSSIFLFSKWANLIGHHSKNNETMKPPQKRRFYFELSSSFPLTHLYVKGGQKWGTIGNSFIRNMSGTGMESRLSTFHVESDQCIDTPNTSWKNKPTLPSHPHKNKNGDPFSPWRDFPLVAWNFYS